MQNPQYNHPEGARAIQRIERMARLMDNQFRIPGTHFRFGLDPILGLIPFAGDGISLIVQAALVLTMRRHGASGKVVTLMVLNIVIDYLVGVIPVVGDALDFFYKSNDKNVRLLKRHYEEGKYQGSGTGIVLLVILLLVGIIAFGIYLLVLFFHWVCQLLS
jgi:hypothetical protein